MKNRMLLLFVILGFLAELNLTALAQESKIAQERILDVVATSHLDTQWRWTIQNTINEFIPATARENFKLFEEFPDYTFSFEGAFRYMLLKEYYPEDYRKLKGYIAAGRWRVAGSWVDAVDVNIPSAESLIRQTLYGNEFFKSEFGKSSVDVFLPDCFGFAYALPSVAAHCGLKGFSTQKLTWGSAYGVPFDIGFWKGVNGSGLVAELNPGSYVSKIRTDLSADTTWIGRIDSLGESSGLYQGYKYFGTGDTGGAPDSESVAWLETSIHGAGPITVRNVSSDDLVRSLTPDQIAGLPQYDGELLMTRHGVGCYTSQAAMKRWNRKNELLANAAESASVMAQVFAGSPYPGERLRNDWIRFLWHQFHDDLTGTSIPEAYEFSWNDEILCQKDLACILENSVEAVAAELDTRVKGIPLIIYNPLGIDRSEIVEASVVFAGNPYESIGVFGPGEAALQTQVIARDDKSATILFRANVPSLGFAVYDVREMKAPASSTNAVQVTDSTISSGKYAVKLNSDGDVTSIVYDGRELLSDPVKLELLTDAPNNWPAWEIDYDDIMAPPRDFVSGPAEISIVEQGPVRGALQIERDFGQSKITQIVKVSDIGVEVDNRVSWKEKETLLKVAFHFDCQNDSVTYDLGLGTIKRGLNRPELYEVPGHQWADLTAEDGSFGVSILNDCKYGWDHPDNATLRLTLIHTPGVSEKWDWVKDQASQDIGEHQFRYAIRGHQGDWRKGEIPWATAEFNQPMLAFQATEHKGVLSKQYSLITVEQQSTTEIAPSVAIKALKFAENSEEVIVRLQELYGHSSEKISVGFSQPILEVHEVNGVEESIGETTILNNALVSTFEPYQVRTFALQLDQMELRPSGPVCESLDLPYNLDGFSYDDAATDGDFDGLARTLAAELIPDTLNLAGIPFVFGSKLLGAHNVVRCEGQEVSLPKGKFDELHLLVCGVTGKPVLGGFTVGKNVNKLWIDDFRQRAGQWNNRITDGRMVQEPNEITPAYINDSDIAWVGSHYHTAEGENAAYEFTCFYRIVLDIPKGAKILKLSNNPAIRLMAATAVKRNRDRVRTAQPLYDTSNSTLVTLLSDGVNFIDSTVVRMSSPIHGAVIRYTYDGSKPTLKSSLYEEQLVLREAATIKARAFKQGMDGAYVATLSVRRRIPRDPVRPVDVSPGLICRYYEGEWSELPNFDSLKVVKATLSNAVTIPDYARPEKFALNFSGYIKVSEDGMYRFYIASDDGSALYIGTERVINNDGLHGEREKWADLALKAGYHPIRIVMFQKLGGLALSAAIESKGKDKQALGEGILFH